MEKYSPQDRTMENKQTKSWCNESCSPEDGTVRKTQPKISLNYNEKRSPEDRTMNNKRILSVAHLRMES